MYNELGIKLIHFAENKRFSKINWLNEQNRAWGDAKSAALG